MFLFVTRNHLFLIRGNRRGRDDRMVTTYAMPIITNVVNSNLAHDGVYSI